MDRHYTFTLGRDKGMVTFDAVLKNGARTRTIHYGCGIGWVVLAVIILLIVIH